MKTTVYSVYNCNDINWKNNEDFNNPESALNYIMSRTNMGDSKCYSDMLRESRAVLLKSWGIHKVLRIGNNIWHIRKTVKDITAPLRNESGLSFSSIDSEEYRTYVFSNGDTVTITEPLYLHVSKSGGHRILDSKEISHYIPSGWIHLYWKAKDEKPHFVK